jgi:hypothetical protein
VWRNGVRNWIEVVLTLLLLLVYGLAMFILGFWLASL